MTAPELPPTSANGAATEDARRDATAAAGPSSSGADAPSSSAATASAQRSSSGCPAHVLEAIYGRPTNKAAQYDHSLKRWWVEYVDRKNDEDEHVADSLLYDRRHLPRTTPAPDVVLAALAAEKAAAEQPIVLATERMALDDV